MMGNGRRRRSPRAVVVALVLASSVVEFGATPAVAISGHGRGLVVARGRSDVSTGFRTSRTAEVLVEITASAPLVSWSRVGAESAVLRVSVDGKYATDDVVMEQTPITRSFDLGTLREGRHELRFHFDEDASAPLAKVVEVHGIEYRLIPAGSRSFVDLSHAPVLYGRNIAGVSGESGAYQNAVTDSPLVAWHEDTPAATSGDRILKYSIVWSNEDGGTSTPALMARWGRTTDIEWIYQVEVDAAGRAVPGSAVFQSPGHGTVQFAGVYEGNHPLLQTCTLNNNVCDHVDDPMRFSLSTLESLDAATQAREQVMDANPWTYRVMAEETRREGKVAANPDPLQTTFIADPQDYLYVVVRKQTVGAPNSGIFWVGLTIGVRLRGDPTLYRSDEGVHPDWSLQRDGPVATTVRLPPRTRPSDIAEIDAIRQPFIKDTGATIEVEAINRVFFLDRRDQPQRSLFSGPTLVTLTAASPNAVLWSS